MKFMCKLGGPLSSRKMVMDNVVDDDSDGDDDAPGCYSLRKKVKESGTAASVTLHLHHVCKECGKGFRSLKALCGHMACHSSKERQRHESQAGDKQGRFAVDDDVECPETVDSSQMQQRCSRSKRVRFRNREAAKLADGFSLISVEEVARCLMMMSNDRRDAGCWVCVMDDSGSHSIEAEDKPPSSGGSASSPRSSEEMMYEPKQKYKNLDTLKGVCTKKIKRGIAMDVEEGSVAVSQEKKRNAKKRDSSKHECPICFRVFKSGQAMGGHKRSHFLQGGVEEAAGSAVVTEKEVPVIDLNFPAYTEEGDEGGIYPW